MLFLHIKKNVCLFEIAIPFPYTFAALKRIMNSFQECRLRTLSSGILSHINFFQFNSGIE